MYDEFQHLALEDATHWGTNAGISSLVKFYGESLLSPHGAIRWQVASDYVELIQSDDGWHAFDRLRSAILSGGIYPESWKRIGYLLDAETLALLTS